MLKNFKIGKEITAGLNGGTSLEERLEYLSNAEQLILSQESTSLLDNFLDEMLDLMNQKEQKIRCFVISFIEKAW